MQKVLIFTPEFYPKSNWGGIATFNKNLCSHLLHMGKKVEVVIISNQNKSTKQYILHKNFTITYIPLIPHTTLGDNSFMQSFLKKVFGIGTSYMPQFWHAIFLSLAYRKHLKSALKNGTITAVHTTLYHSCGVFSAFLKNTKFIFHIQGPQILFTAFEKFDLDHILVSFFELIPLITPFSNATFVPCSNGVRDYFQKKFRKKFFTIPNSITFNQTTKRKSSTPNLILYFGQLAYRKGADLVIESFINYKKVNKNAVLILLGNEGVGFGKNRNLTFFEWFNKLDIDETILNDIHFFKAINSKAMLYRLLAKLECIILLPSRVEPFGYSICEALSSGNITITTKTWGAEQQITDTVNGFFVEKTATSIGKMLEKVSNLSVEEKKSISQNALTYSKVHHFPMTSDSYKELYNQPQ